MSVPHLVDEKQVLVLKRLYCWATALLVRLLLNCRYNLQEVKQAAVLQVSTEARSSTKLGTARALDCGRRHLACRTPPSLCVTSLPPYLCVINVLTPRLLPLP